MGTPVDPVFESVCKALYGSAVDVRELWVLSKMDDSSEVHVANAPAKKKSDAKTALAGGLLLGSVAEGAAVGHAAREFAETGYRAAHAAPKVPSALARLSGTRQGRATHLGLQAVNMGVGLAAAREILPRKAKVAKMRRVPIPHVEPAVLVHADHRARRAGLRLVGAVGVGSSAAGGYAYGRHTRVAPRTPLPTGEIVKISKVDEDKHLVFGWASVAEVDGEPVLDLQDDTIEIEEVEKAAYGYVLSCRKGGVMHERVGKSAPKQIADLVESFVATPEKLDAMGLPPDALPLGHWVGFKVTDEPTWQRVKSGELQGFSIHGTGNRRKVAV